MDEICFKDELTGVVKQHARDSRFRGETKFVKYKNRILFSVVEACAIKRVKLRKIGDRADGK